MVELKDILDYVFGDQIEKDLSVVPAAQEEGVLGAKQQELRAKLQEKFGKHIEKDSFVHFVYTNNKQLARVLYGVQEEEAEEDTESFFPSNDAIIAGFRKIHEKHKFNLNSPPESIHQVYIKLFKLAKFIGEIIEENAGEDDTQSFMHAYKMLLIWGDNLAEIDRYLSQNYLDHEHPLYDALVFSIPEDGSNVHMQDWIRLLKFGPQILKFFKVALEIEAKLGGRAPTTTEEASDAAVKLSYVRASENPELACICYECGISELVFNKILELEKTRTVQKDCLPDIHISGIDIGEKYAGHHLVKMPKSDLRGYILGELTNCCQSVGETGEKYAIDGMNRSHNGFYVLLKPITKAAKSRQNPFKAAEIDYDSFKIVGQCYAWISIHGNLVLNSWENLEKEDTEKAIEFVKRLALTMVQDPSFSIGRVTIGSGGQTPEDLKKIKCEFVDKTFEGSASYDSHKQYLLSCSAVLETTPLRLKLKNKFYSLSFLRTLEENASLLNQIKLLEESGVTAEVFNYLTSEVALKFYHKFPSITPEWLAILSQENAKILGCLLSFCAFYIYDTTDITPEKLVQMGDAEVLASITSHEALRIYESCRGFTPTELLQVTQGNKETLAQVVSTVAVRVYSLFPGEFTPRDLLGMSGSNEKLMALVLSDETEELYIKFKISPKELLSISSDIEFLEQLLPGGYGWNFYKAFPIHPRELAQLARFDLKLLKCIMNVSYQRFPSLTPHELMAISGGDVQILQMLGRWENWLTGRLKFSLQEYFSASGKNSAMLKALIHTNIYEKFPHITPQALVEISRGDHQLIQALTDAGGLYQKFPDLTPQILVEISNGQCALVRVLAESYALYEKFPVQLFPNINPKEVIASSGHSVSVISAITFPAMKFYELFPTITPIQLLQIAHTDAALIAAIVCDKALAFYAKHSQRPEKLVQLSRRQASAVDTVLEACSTLSATLVSKLSSCAALKLYRDFDFTFEALCKLSERGEDYIALIISHKALQTYANFHDITPQKLIAECKNSDELNCKIATYSAPKGLLSDGLPALGVQYAPNQIASVISSMLAAAEISDVKVMAPARVIVGMSGSIDGCASELFSSKAVIMPIELWSVEGSHWVFLIVDSQSVKLIDTENAHEATLKALLPASLSSLPFSTVSIDHQLYSDSCGIEGISQLTAYLKNTTSIDPESAAVIQGVTYLDYLTGALGSIFNVDHFYRVKDYLLAQANECLNFALDTNNQALVVDLIDQANSIQGMLPLVVGGAPFKPDYDGPGGYFGRDEGAVPDQDSVGLAGGQSNQTNHTDA